MLTKTIFELLNEAGKAITSEIELEKVVQRVTDIGTELIHAQFGAFFYNVVNHNNETLVLYTISGVAKEAFSKFPMPRNTKIFEPTFTAKGTVRYDDVTEQPHYGQNEPYYGMPKGHLPVKSYLAVPVISPITKEPIGGLFFGHAEAGIFSEESEKLIEGVAIQAAIAMGNARLFEEKRQTEKKLLEQKEQYQSIFKATSESLIIYNENGFIEEANPSASVIFGYTYDELIGLHASKLFLHAEDFQTLKEIAFSGREYFGTHTRVKKDGSHVDVSFRGYQFIYKGKPHVLSAAKDVTVGKRTEEELKKSKEFAQAITDISPAALWMTDAGGETIYVNKTWVEWSGKNQKDFLTEGWLLPVFKEDEANATKSFEDAFRNRRAFSFDFRIKRRNGDIRWCSTNGIPFNDNDGTFAGFVGSVTDVTDRKLVEEKLARQNVLINTITSNTLQALFLMDDRQYCTYMNPAAEKMIGFTLEEVREKPLHYYIHHTHPDGTHFPIEDCPIDRALPTKNQTQGEEIFIRRDGSFFPVSFIASPIIKDGFPIGTVIEARDTTEEKRIQEELRNKEKQAMEMLEQKVKERTVELEKSNYELLQFTSVASHDLKEPIRKISIFSKLLKDNNSDKLDDRSIKHVDNIISSSKRMATLIDDLLDFSRLSQVEHKFVPVNLKDLIERIVDDFEIEIASKGGTVLYDNMPTVNGIGFQLGQLFQNLISNSIKFSHPERKPVINIEANIKANTATIIYSDNGIGFSPVFNEKIFGVFERLHTKDQYQGTGVGLAIVKKIVSIHKGEIKAMGTENEGAIFEIKLPVK